MLNNNKIKIFFIVLILKTILSLNFSQNVKLKLFLFKNTKMFVNKTQML